MNYDELEAKVVKAIDEKPLSFAQEEKAPRFEQVLGISEDVIGMGVGGALTGIVSSAVSKVSPIDLDSFGIGGVTPIVAGLAIKKIVKPKGILGGITTGLIIAGISQAVSGFIPDMAQERTAIELPEENTQIMQGVVF
jgi:hypothetical protein